MIRPDTILARARGRARERARRRPPDTDDVIETWRRILHAGDYLRLSQGDRLLDVVTDAMKRAAQLGPLFTADEADALRDLADEPFDEEVAADVTALFVSAEGRFAETRAAIEAGLKMPLGGWLPAAWLT